MIKKIDSYTQKHLLTLVSEAKQHGLVLFVGSGINALALPQWGRLLERILDVTIQEVEHEDSRIGRFRKQLSKWCKSHFDVCAQASLIKHILGPDRYRLEIQNALYCDPLDIENEVRDYCRHRKRGKKNIIQEKHDRFEYLWAVANLCSTEQVKAVATFNFDTLLETAIEECGLKQPRAYFGQVGTMEQHTASFSKLILPVYHVHGLLSPPQTLLRSSGESVVFSFDEYFNQNADPLSWETATSLHLLRHYCTLWLGASLKDWNMMRLLNAAMINQSETHTYCLQCLQDIRDYSVVFKEIALRFQASLFDSVGVRLVVGGKEYSCLPVILSNEITAELNKSSKKDT